MKTLPLRLVSERNKYDLPLVVLSIISFFLFLTMENNIFPLVILLLSYLYLLKNWRLLLVAIVFSIFIFILFVNTRPGSFEEDEYISGKYKIVEVTSLGPIIKYKGEYILLNTFNEQYFKGEIIQVSGLIQIVENKGDFNIEGFLRGYNIINIVNRPEIRVIEKYVGIHRRIYDYFRLSGGNWGKIAPLFLLGEKTDLTKDVYNQALQMNIVHLFVISGFHISLLYKGVSKGLHFAGMKEGFAKVFALIIPLIYLFLLDFSISATRVLLMTLLVLGNRYWMKLKLRKYELLSIVTLLMFLSNPFIVYRYSFIFSFIASATIAFVSEREFNKESHKNIAIGFSAYLSTLLIAIFLNKQFSVFSVLFAIGFTPIFAFYYVATLFLFPFISILDKLYDPFIFLLNSASSINYTIKFFEISPLIIQTIYFIIISSIIILVTWNLYMEMRLFSLKKLLRRFIRKKD